MKPTPKQLLSLALYLTAFSAGCAARAQDGPLAPKDVPPLTIPAGSGLVVDSYDHGNYFGAFKDDKGSTFTADTYPYTDGKNGKFLFGSFHLAPGGYVGLWGIPGEKWNNTQDWSHAKTITLDAFTSKPMTFHFTFKGSNGLKYEGEAATTTARVWQKLSIPVASLTNIASQIGQIGGFDLNIGSDGDGQFALDNLVAEGASPQTAQAVPSGVVLGDDGKPLEMRGSVIFAKTLVPPAARSHKIYVVDARRGKDENPGTAAKPWATIQKAADALLPGDTVLVRNGTYISPTDSHQDGAVITRSGAPGAFLTFQAAPGQHPVTTFSLQEASYIDIAGFDLSTELPGVTPDNQKERYGIGMDRSHHIRIRDNRVYNCGEGGIGSGHSDYLFIDGNIVHDNAFLSIYNGSGISLWENRAFDDKPGYHDIVSHNVCYRNENKGPTPLYGGELTDGNGIILDWQRGVAPVLIENNVCYDNGGRGVHIFHSAHVLVRDNTLVGNERTHGAKGCDLRVNTSSDVRLTGNIVVGRTGQEFSKNYQPENVVYDHNLFYNYTSVDPAEMGAGNIVGKNPQFVNASLTPGTADFRLRPGSPAQGLGAALTPGRPLLTRN